MIELGVNIDHVATLRQARRTWEPDPVWAAVEAHLGGADGISRGNVIARTFCDIHTGRTHVANNPNAVGRNVGSVMLGGANADSFI